MALLGFLIMKCYLIGKLLSPRPSSLVAVGLWGNTLLLHGELKLRLSRDLQSMLLEPFSQSVVQHNSWEAAREKEVHNENLSMRIWQLFSFKTILFGMICCAKPEP
jgi:hypothetical protein